MQDSKIHAKKDFEIQAKQDAKIQAEQDGQIQTKQDAEIQAKQDSKIQVKKDFEGSPLIVMCLECPVSSKWNQRLKQNETKGGALYLIFLSQS